MRPTPYVASLRIYEPLDAFEPVDQLRWASLDASEDSRKQEQFLALKRVAFPESPLASADGAHVLDLDGRRYVAPWSTATRTWAAVEEFKASLPATVTPFFLPQSLEDVLTQGIDESPERVPHIITATWVIPPRWFTLFVPDEIERGHDGDGAYCRIRTHVSLAKQRAKVAHAAVLNAFGPGFVEAELMQLKEWLELFHFESLVELDYGGLAMYMEKVLTEQGLDLTADTSVEDIAMSLVGLTQGNGELAGQGYSRIVSRWRGVQACESAS